MVDFKISGIIAGAAFLLSFLIGLVSGVDMPMLFLKPVFFAVLFFVITNVVKLVAERFLPELLEGGGEVTGAEFLPGSRVNIVEGDSAAYESPSALSPTPAFMNSHSDDSEEAVGDISALMERGGGFSRAAARENPEAVNSQGMDPPSVDQNAEAGYTKPGDIGELPGAGASGPPGEAPAPAFDSGELLPDLDSMVGAFVSDSAAEDSETTEYSVSTPPRTQASSGKAPAWAGDFNAKDIAAGLRTVLNKDKEG